MKLHLGCGDKYLPGFIHIDINTGPHIDHNCPIDQLSFIQDEHVDLIYCCGAFEYFDREEAIGVLAEWRRVLKPGGTLRLSVPNLASIMAVYLYQKDADKQGILGPLYGRWELKDQHVYGAQFIYHKTVYDPTSLNRLLKAADFREIRPYSPEDVLPDDFDDYSKAYMPHMDPTGLSMSLNLEGTK